MWKYNDGTWYTNIAGNSIWYIEKNPCGCCPDSLFIEYKSPITYNKTVKFTSYSKLEDILKQRALIELK